MPIEEMPDSYKEHQGDPIHEEPANNEFEKKKNELNFGFQKRDIEEETPRQRLERIIEDYEKRHGKKNLPFFIKKKKD